MFQVKMTPRLIAIPAALILLAGCGSTASSTDKPAKTKTTAATKTTTAAKTPPPPIKTRSQVVTEAVSKAMGKSNRGAKQRVAVQMAGKSGETIVITYAAQDSLTDGLRKDEVRRDGTTALKAVAKSATYPYAAVKLIGTFELVDQLGNTSEDVVYKTTVDKATIDKINFDNFDFKNLDDIGTNTFIHYLYRY